VQIGEHREMLGELGPRLARGGAIGQRAAELALVGGDRGGIGGRLGRFRFGLGLGFGSESPGAGARAGTRDRSTCARRRRMLARDRGDRGAVPVGGRVQLGERAQRVAGRRAGRRR